MSGSAGAKNMEYPNLMNLTRAQAEAFRERAAGGKAVIWVHPFYAPLDRHGGDRYDRVMTGILKRSQKSGRPVIVLEPEGRVGDTIVELKKRGFTPENTPLYFVETWPKRPDPSEGGWDAFHKVLSDAGVRTVSVGGQRLTYAGVGLFPSSGRPKHPTGFLRDAYEAHDHSMRRLDGTVIKALKGAAHKPPGERDRQAKQILKWASSKKEDMENRVPTECVGNTLNALRARGIRASAIEHGVLPKRLPRP